MNKKKVIISAIFILITVIMGILYYTSSLYVSTDNARIKFANIQIAAEVSGYVSKMYYNNNEQVEKDALLLKIEDEKYKIAVQKEAADYNYYKKECERYTKLYKKSAIQIAELEKAERNYKASESSLNLAKYNLGKTTIYSHVNGFIGNADEIKVGDYVAQGMPLFNIIDKSDIWIEANFKEVDLKNVRIGQKAKVWIDAFGNKEFSATVKSISPATGSEFSMLPPQNTSGNWVKVIQRINVRLELNSKEDIDKMSTGMSAYVKIYIKP